MADFTSKFWEWYILILVALSIAACFALVIWMSRGRKPGTKVETMGHVWDEDLAEFNNPLPIWWLYMFYITLVFGIVYLLIYPGSGVFAGAFKWSEVGQYEQEMKSLNRSTDRCTRSSHAGHRDRGLQPEALKMGQRLFMTYCTACHGRRRWWPGFPNLRDQDWLYGACPKPSRPVLWMAAMAPCRRGVRYSAARYA